MARFSKDTQLLRNLACVSVSLAGLLSAPGVLAGNVTIFQAKIGYEGTCTVDVPGTVTFNNSASVRPSQIEVKDEAAIKTSRVTLNGCSGVGLTPKITVSGNVNTSYGEKLFRDTTSTAVGYGILLSTSGTTYFQANDNLASKNVIAAKNWATTTSLDKINGDIPLSAVLTCGTCTASGRIGGDLKATVTFNFSYD